MHDAARPELQQTPCVPRLLALAFVLLMHLGLLRWALHPPGPVPDDEPAALASLQVSLLPPVEAPRSAPAALSFGAPVPRPRVQTRLPDLVVEDPPAPRKPSPSLATASAPRFNREGRVAAADCLPRAWLVRLSQAISTRLHYPALSRQLGERGTAYVRISVTRAGTVLDAPLLRSSGHAALDAEARGVVMRIGRFGPVPSGECEGFDTLVIDQPIRFGGR